MNNKNHQFQKFLIFQFLPVEQSKVQQLSWKHFFYFFWVVVYLPEIGNKLLWKNVGGGRDDGLWWQGEFWEKLWRLKTKSVGRIFGEKFSSSLTKDAKKFCDFLIIYISTTSFFWCCGLTFRIGGWYIFLLVWDRFADYYWQRENGSFSFF